MPADKRSEHAPFFSTSQPTPPIMPPLNHWIMDEPTRNKLLKEYKTQVASAASTVCATFAVVSIHASSPREPCHLWPEYVLNQIKLSPDPPGEYQDTHADVRILSPMTNGWKPLTAAAMISRTFLSVPATCGGTRAPEASLLVCSFILSCFLRRITGFNPRLSPAVG